MASTGSKKTQATAARRLIIAAANKGGVGKSMIVRLLIDLARMVGRSIAAFDLDAKNGSLARLYPDRNATVGVAVEDVTDPRASAWVDAIAGDADDVILDVPGGKTDALYAALSGSSATPHDLIAYAESHGRQIVLVSPIGVKKDSLRTVVDAIEGFGAHASHVIIKNGFFGDDGDFVVFDGDREQGRFGVVGKMARDASAQIIFLPRLSAIADAIADQLDLSFTRAIADPEQLGRRYHHHMRSWMDAGKRAIAGTSVDMVAPQVAAVS